MPRGNKIYSTSFNMLHYLLLSKYVNRVSQSPGESLISYISVTQIERTNAPTTLLEHEYLTYGIKDSLVIPY